MRDIFEKTLFENPDDLATHSAYADWLMERNDPRGEFMLVQLRIEQTVDEAERKSLRKRSRELQSLHEDKWLGGLGRLLLGHGREEFNYTFVRGWLHSLGVRQMRQTMAEALARAPAARLLRQLTMNEVPGAAGRARKALGVLFASPKLANLETFRAAKFADGDEVCQALASSGKLARLRHLALTSGRITGTGIDHLLACPDFRQLQTLDLSSNEIPEAKCDEVTELLPHANLSSQTFRRADAVAPGGGGHDDLYDDNWE